MLGVTLAGVLSEAFREWLLANESGSTTIRNLGLVLAGLIALPLAIWRGLVAERQANAAQQSLRNDRYQKGAEMLGNERLSVRLGGIYALQRLAEEYPEEYYEQIVNLFCAFVRHPTLDKRHEEEVKAKWGMPQVRDDVKAVMLAIGERDKVKVALKLRKGSSLDLDNAYLVLANLSGANLVGAHLRQTNLQHATLRETNLGSVFAFDTKLQDANLEKALLCNAFLAVANLSGANLMEADLSNADLGGADLYNSTLSHANLTNCKLINADVSGTDFRQARGLTQAQLDQARANPANPPELDGTLDAETGKQLEWKGKPPKDED